MPSSDGHFGIYTHVKTKNIIKDHIMLIYLQVSSRFLPPDMMIFIYFPKWSYVIKLCSALVTILDFWSMWNKGELCTGTLKQRVLLSVFRKYKLMDDKRNVIVIVQMAICARWAKNEFMTRSDKIVLILAHTHHSIAENSAKHVDNCDFNIFINIKNKQQIIADSTSNFLTS